MKIFRTKSFLIKFFPLIPILIGVIFLGQFSFVKANPITKKITVNFATTPNSVTVSKAQLKYNKNFALSYSFDDGLDDGYDPAFKYMFGGYSIYLGQYFGGLYFTDGAGNNVPFRGGYAFYARNSSYSDIHVNTPSYINWTQLQDVVDNGWDVFNHGYTSASVPANDPNKIYYIGDPGGHAEGPLDYEYELLRFNVDIGSHINLKNNAGATTGSFQSTQVILPNGDENYIQPAFDNGFKATYAQNPTFTFDGNTVVAPTYTSVNDTISSNRHVMPRWFDYETRYTEGGQYPGALFNHVDTLASTSTGATKYWSQEFTHQITTSTYPGDWSGGITWNSWKSLMDHIENTYGRFGNDTAWVAGAQEVYDYMMVKQNTTLSQNLVGNQLEITLDITNVPTGLRHYALSLLVNSDAQISSIDYGSDFTTSTDNETTGLINVDWGVNTYSSNDITRVEGLVATAENNRSLASINSARNYVNLLSDTQQLSQKNGFNARLDAIVVPLRTWYVNIKGNITSSATINSCLKTNVTYVASSYKWNDFCVGKNSLYTGNDLINMTDSDGATSTVSLSNTASFNTGGIATASTNNNSGLYPDLVIGTAADLYAPTPVLPAKIKIYGLNNSKNYNIKLFGYTSASSYIGDRATTQYTIGGVVKDLYVRGNLTETVLFSNIVPVSGEIEVTINPKQNNYGYGILNAMEIIENLLPAPTNLSYTSPNVYTKNSAITPLSPTVTGLEVFYSVSPALPTGLSFDTSTGIISGTPTVVTPRATYTVTATNTGGSTTFGVVIAVNDIAPSALSYSSPKIYTRGTSITPLSPTVTGTPVSYTVSPDLPAGLTLDTSTGIISGTPTVFASLSAYTITATNTGGSTTFDVVITVNDIAPSALSYTSPNIFTRGSAITQLSPNITGIPTGYSISPDLPTGISLNTSTGIISGTPTGIASINTYTVTATNTSGSTTFDITITVNDIPISTPVATPPAGTYNSTQSVTLVSEGSDFIRYSTIETPTTCSGGTLYSGVISVSVSETIYVRACNDVGGYSTATFSYIIDLSAPSTAVATPSAGIYNSAQSVAIVSEGSDSIRYSTNTTPNNCTSGSLYSSLILIETSQTIYVRACDGAGNSSTTSFVYTIDTVSPGVPIASPVAGTYETNQLVSLTAEDSSSIRYSTISLPENCSSGSLYSSSISITTSQTIYVRVCDSAGNSSTTSFAYVITVDNDAPIYMKYSTTSTPVDCLSGTLYSDSMTFPSSTRVYVRVCNSLNNASISTFEFITPSNSTGRSGGSMQVNKKNIVTDKIVLPVINTLNPVVDLNKTKDQKISYIQKITKDLKFGMKNNKEIKSLQLFLAEQSLGPSAKALMKHGLTNNFGILTKNALAEWQKINNVYPASGYFGPKTRAKIKLLNL